MWSVSRSALGRYTAAVTVAVTLAVERAAVNSRQRRRDGDVDCPTRRDRYMSDSILGKTTSDRASRVHAEFLLVPLVVSGDR